MNDTTKLIKLLDAILGVYRFDAWENSDKIAANLISNGVTFKEKLEEGCGYCDIAKANEGIINTNLWVKEPETNKWTMLGKQLKFCPMCGRRL